MYRYVIVLLLLAGGVLLVKHGEPLVAGIPGALAGILLARALAAIPND